MEQVRQDIVGLQSEVDRLTREKLEDRMRLASLERHIQNENNTTANKVFQAASVVSSYASPVFASLSTSLTSLTGAILAAAAPRSKRRKRRTNQTTQHAFL